MQLLNEELDESIVQQNTDQHQQKIPEQLNPPPNDGIRKNYMSHQEKPGWKTHAERNNECRNMWLESQESNVQDFFMKNKIVANEINENIQHRIGAATCSVAECLQWHNLFKRRVKNIYKRNDPLLRHTDPNVGGAKVV